MKKLLSRTTLALVALVLLLGSNAFADMKIKRLADSFRDGEKTMGDLTAIHCVGGTNNTHYHPHSLQFPSLV